MMTLPQLMLVRGREMVRARKNDANREAVAAVLAEYIATLVMASPDVSSIYRTLLGDQDEADV